MHYLASPYTHSDPEVVLSRYDDTLLAVSTLARLNIHVISPIILWHQAAITHSLPTSHHFWQSFNESLLTRCSSLILLQLDGWQSSAGIAHELNFAAAHQLPITHLTPSSLLLLSATEAHQLFL
jgi:hypothetical protein